MSFYFNATGVTPAMATTRAGECSDYALACLDANKKAFDGSKTSPKPPAGKESNWVQTVPGSRGG
jgi:hypothetical protein